jgi:hypothetical protein
MAGKQSHAIQNEQDILAEPVKNVEKSVSKEFIWKVKAFY